MPDMPRLQLGGSRLMSKEDLDPINIAAGSRPGTYKSPQIRLNRLSAVSESTALSNRLAEFNEDLTGDPNAPPPKRWMPFMDGRLAHASLCLILPWRGLPSSGLQVLLM